MRGVGYFRHGNDVHLPDLDWKCSENGKNDVKF